jgi:hypothetical protein
MRPRFATRKHKCLPGSSARTPLVVCLRATPRVRSPAGSVSSSPCSSWRVPPTRSSNSRSCTPPVVPSLPATTQQVCWRRHPRLRLRRLAPPAVLDAKGRFLFAGGNNSIHMYQVDSVTGSYTEVPGSPFASANTNSPALIATEPTGAYLAVVNSIGLNPGESSVESFQINAAAGALVPVSGSFLELVSTPIGAAANPSTGRFYVCLGPNLLSPNPDYQQDGDLLTYTINPLTASSAMKLARGDRSIVDARSAQTLWGVLWLPVRANFWEPSRSRPQPACRDF